MTQPLTRFPPSTAATPPTVVGQHYCQGQLPLRDALVRRLRGWVIASHQASIWPATPPGGCSAPATQYSGRPLPPRLGLFPRLGRPAPGRQHRPIGTTIFPPGTARPGTVGSRNRQDVPPAGAPAARSRLYLYLVISPAVTFAAALDTRTAPHHPGRIINVLDTRYTILIKTRLPRASSQKWKSVRVKCSIVPLRAIVRKRAAWILNHAADGTLRPAPKRFVSGETLPYVGRNVKSIVESANVRRPEVRFDHWRFRISVPRDLEGVDRYERIRRAVVEWYRVRAADRLRDNVNRWWHRLGNGAQQQILIRDQRQRWGSCASDGES